jgi:hypothetical protein
MNYRAESRAVSKIATPKNNAASRGVFIIPRQRDKKDASDEPARLRPFVIKRNDYFPHTENGISP